MGYTLKWKLTRDGAEGMAAIYNSANTPPHETFGVVPRPADERITHLINEAGNGGLIIVRVQNDSDKAWLARMRVQFEALAHSTEIREMESFEDRFPYLAKREPLDAAEDEPLDAAEDEALPAAEDEPLPAAEDKQRFGGARRLKTRPDPR
jgi:hypothetical protein